VTRLRPQRGPDLVEEATEACSGAEGFEPTRGPIALFDAPMVLLQMIIQVAVRPMDHPASKDVPNGAWVGIMAIGGDPVRSHPGHRPGRAEEGLGCGKVAGVAEPCVD
jgi:hypothetical protein